MRGELWRRLFRRDGRFLSNACKAGRDAVSSLGGITVIMLIGLLFVGGQGHAGTGGEAHLSPRQPIAAPVGFTGVCARYEWACARSGQENLRKDVALKLAQAVNTVVNRSTRAVSDRQQYGSEEVWALPTKYGGDCEDIVLLKKRELIVQGISPENLLIATVLDRRRVAHAVLVLRTGDEDLVLDNLKNRILPWHKTGYSFLRMQNPSAPAKWDAVMAGGLFR